MLSWISKIVFHTLGWRVEGRYPSELKKKVIIVAPHTSAWDIVIGLLFKFWMRIDVAFYAKKELFKGVQGWILTKLGFLPVDRSQANNLVDQIVKDFDSGKIEALGITPEGTRRKVSKFKSGFYYVALKANVPIIPIAIDFQNKVVRVLETYYVKGEGEIELKVIESWFRGIQGKIPENSF